MNYFIIAATLFTVCPVLLCLVSISMKPLLLKSSDWSAESVCCDWSTNRSTVTKMSCPLP